MSGDNWVKAFMEVGRLVSEAEFKANRNFVERPAGWEHIDMLYRRAITSGEQARYGDKPNYPRLLLAHAELKQVV